MDKRAVIGKVSMERRFIKKLFTKECIDVPLTLLVTVFLVTAHAASGTMQTILSAASIICACMWCVRFFMAAWEEVKSSYSRISETTDQPSKGYDEPRLAIRFLKSLFPSDESQQNIIGDLLEEFSEFESKTAAYVWLYKQILKSVLPLAYKNLKSRLAYYFGERIR